MAFSTFVEGGPRYDAVRNRYVAGTSENDVFGYTVDSALSIANGLHKILKPSVAALTLAPPTASDEGIVITVVAGTAFAHVLTVTGGLGGNAGDDVITFAKVGDMIRLRAINLRWVPEGAPYGAVIS